MPKKSTSKNTKAQKPRMSKREAAHKSHKKLVATQNQGIDHKKILSSGRKLPSETDWDQLSLHCEIAYKGLQLAKSKLETKLPKLEALYEALKNKYKRNNILIHNDPASYRLKQQIKILKQQEEAAKTLYEDLQDRYKRSTGRPWKPRIDINKPLGK